MTKKWSAIRRSKAAPEPAPEPQEPVEEEPAPQRCIHCHIRVVPVGGIPLNSGAVSEFRHDWGTMRVNDRPGCPLMWGPVPAEDVEPAEG